MWIIGDGDAFAAVFGISIIWLALPSYSHYRLCFASTFLILLW
jgi:hypothetical protein